MQKLQKKIGYTFKNLQLLEQALTHTSYTTDIYRNYERLEFLGDRILGLVIAEMLCATFNNEPEGSLAQRFVKLVCKEAVAEVARELSLDKYIIAKDTHVSDSENVLCDVGEAVIAAIYLDSGDIEMAKKFIHANWAPLIDRKSKPHKDYKTLLQEEAYNLKCEVPSYRLLTKTGSDHEPEFCIEVSVGNGKSATGLGRSKKLAEQAAALNMLKILGVENV